MQTVIHRNDRILNSYWGCAMYYAEAHFIFSTSFLGFAIEVHGPYLIHVRLLMIQQIPLTAFCHFQQRISGNSIPCLGVLTFHRRITIKLLSNERHFRPSFFVCSVGLICSEDCHCTQIVFVHLKWPKLISAICEMLKKLSVE